MPLFRNFAGTSELAGVKVRKHDNPQKYKEYEKTDS
jgi:hypothetical protein